MPTAWPWARCVCESRGGGPVSGFDRPRFLRVFTAGVYFFLVKSGPNSSVGRMAYVK